MSPRTEILRPISTGVLWPEMNPAPRSESLEDQACTEQAARMQSQTCAETTWIGNSEQSRCLKAYLQAVQFCLQPPITNQEHNTGLVSADGGVSGGAHHTILGRHADVPPAGYKGKKRPFKRTIKRPDTSIFRMKSMPDSATENVPPLSNTIAAASATGNEQAQLSQQQ